MSETHKKTSAAPLINSIILPAFEDSSDTSPIAKDRRAAMHDLLIESVFRPAQDDCSPYDLNLSIEDNRLVLGIANKEGRNLPTLILSLKPYKRLIQDYFMIVRSYDDALKDGKPSRIEAIDMGRRALHNEGADLLIERLTGKIEMDHPTARRLFTLICVLHEAKALQWR